MILMFENGNPFRKIQSRTKLAVPVTLGTVLILAILTPVLNIPVLPSVLLPAAIAADDNGKKGDKKQKFEILEATIEDIHKAIKSKQLTATELVNMYLERIKAYNGVCVNEPEGILGPISTIPNAGQLNALLTLNLRPDAREEWGFDERKARSMTDPLDDDPIMPDALEVAAALDEHFKKTGKLVGPLHGVVIAIKDQYDTFDMRSTSGADVFYANDRPPDDATFVKKLREAGAIIIAKGNMGQYGSGFRSSFGGTTCNPYDTERSPGTSSGGPGAAVAANLVTCAIAEESGNSIRFPARVNNAVGIVPTRELVSGDGMVAAGAIGDRVGPICRTVEDVARVLDVYAGFDPKDELTAFSINRMPTEPYQSSAEVDKDGLEGMRIGVVREYMDKDLFTAADHETIDIIDRAIEDLEDLGATIVDPGDGGALFQDCVDKLVPTWNNRLFINQFPTQFPANTDHIPLLVDMFLDPSLVPHTSTGQPSIRNLGPEPGDTGGNKYYVNRYLQERGDANIHSLTDLINKANFWNDPAIANGKTGLINNDAALTLATQTAMQTRFTSHTIIHQCFAELNLDAVVYPTGNIPPKILTAPDEPTKNDRIARAWNFITTKGFPAISVPAGFTTHVFDRDADLNLVEVQAKLPVGIDILGLPFDEPTLFKIAAAYEAATHHRTPPADFGPVTE
jgi:Asp-tRNA(Asn)/Glu-tRNA(Gln) amidotransferase A subunit family amidase